MRKLAIALVAGAMFASGAANAAIVTKTGGSLTVSEGQPTPNETNIYFIGITNTLTGQGNVGSQTGSPTFNFQVNTASDFAQGFATITPDVGTLSQLVVTAPTGYLFNDLVFQALGPSGTAATNLILTAYRGGVLGTQLGSVTFDSIGEGANAFLSFIVNGGLMDTLVLQSTTTGIAQFKQFEVSGLTAVPLPPAALLFGTALAGLGLLSRGRKQKQVA